MKKRIKPIALLMSAVLIGAPLAACGKSADSKSESAANSSGEEAGGKTVLTVVTAGGGFWDEPMAKIEADYEEKHPNIDLNIQIFGYEQLFQNVEVKMGAESDEYDVIAVDFPMVAAYADRGYIQPLDDWFDAAEYDLFVDSSRSASFWQERFMAAPMESSAMLLFYNKGLLEEAGVDFKIEENEHVTWEKLVETSKQVLDKMDPQRSGEYSGIGLEQVSRPYQVLPLANTLGEKGIADDGFTVDGVLNTPGWVTAMDFYASLFEEGICPRGVKAEEMGPLFYSGKMLFYIGGSWNYWTAMGTEGFDFGFGLFPTFEGYEAQTATPTGSYHLGISAYSKNADAAADFIRYITLEEGNALWCAESGSVPALKSELESILNSEDALETYKLCAYDVYNTGYPRPVSPGYTEWESVVTASFEDIRNGGDPKSALDSAVSQIDQLFRKYTD